MKASDQQAGFVDFCGMLVYEPIGYTLCQSTFGEYNHLFLITKPIVVMKPIYLLLLVLLPTAYWLLYIMPTTCIPLLHATRFPFPFYQLHPTLYSTNSIECQLACYIHLHVINSMRNCIPLTSADVKQSTLHFANSNPCLSCVHPIS